MFIDVNFNRLTAFKCRVGRPMDDETRKKRPKEIKNFFVDVSMTLDGWMKKMLNFLPRISLM